MENFINATDDLIGLSVAFCLGAIIGIQRGWKDRHHEDGWRVAGIRTHILISMFGAISALISKAFSPIFLGISFFAVAIVLAIAYLNAQKATQDRSITTTIGSLITFVLGALACLGQPEVAAAVAVIVAIVLDNKKEIHGLLRKLKEKELDAGLKLLLISVVFLPFLPNTQLGPWNAINPFEVWWMVVLISSISFLGYFAIRIAGPEKGIIFTGIFGGLSSSTALTLHYSKLGQEKPELSPLLATGILLACGTMFPRMLIVCFIINAELAKMLILPIAAMTALVYIPSLIIWYIGRNKALSNGMSPLHNPLELSSAVFFGALLAVTMLLSQALQHWFGDAGVYLLASVSGLSDVDAVNLALSRGSLNGLALDVAAKGIIIAAMANSLVKSGMVAVFSKGKLSLQVCTPLMLASAAGGVVAFLF